MSEAVWVSYGLNVILAIGMFILKRSLETSDQKHVDARNERNQLAKDIQQIRQDYLHKEDFREFKMELRGMFEELKTSIKDLKRTHE